MNYWLDLFTSNTWEEFRLAGASLTGFPERKSKVVATVRSGDVLICYVTGLKRWVGALQVTGPSTDQRKIWAKELFPVRLAVTPLILLTPDSGVPMSALEGRVDFYRGPQDRGTFKGFVRRSPNQFYNPADAILVIELLKDAQTLLRP